MREFCGKATTCLTRTEDGATLVMPNSPKIGDKFENDKTVVDVGVTVPVLSTGLGPFTNCFKAVENDGDVVYYAPGLGQVKKEYKYEQGGFELKEVILGPGYSIIDDSMKITVHNFLYNGLQLDITATFENYINSADPSGLYWKLKELNSN